jgi:hypothetical protein
MVATMLAAVKKLCQGLGLIAMFESTPGASSCAESMNSLASSPASSI